MSRMPNLQQLWPDLFHGLSDDQIETILEISANSYLETGQVNRLASELLCRAFRGEITFDEANHIALEHTINKA